MSHSTRLTAIVATIGPACASERVLQRMVRAGIDVARLNMSHGDHAFHRRMVRLVRRVARRVGRPVGIMADLQGPKVRLGSFPGPVRLRRGMTVVLTTRAREVDPDRLVLPVDYRHLPLETSRGHELLLADGAVRLRVERVRGHRVTCTVLEGRELTPRTGLSLPHATAVRSALTAKDRRDLALAVELGVDFVACSFVRRPEDLRQARNLVRRLGGDQHLVAKIETRQAVERLDDILAEADAVMVARGDLGIDLPPERVPIEQKRIIQVAGAAGKPVITATQMLESMRFASRPTRAEASDVANAVFDGTWAVMLSAETASGDYPVESVRMMGRIVRAAEEMLLRRPRRRPTTAAHSIAEGVAETGAWLAFEVGARAMVALTRSGATARQVARQLPGLPTFAYTPSRRVLTKMTLYRGIEPRLLPMQRTFTAAIRKIEEDLRRRRDVDPGELVVILGGSPDEPLGVTNRIVVHQVR